jgi:predicted nucleic-acid-binding Zn-ribbon protein
MTTTTTTTSTYECLRCKHRQYSLGSMRASGSGFMAILDIENRSFTTVSCERCGFTEFYKTDEAGFLKMLADGFFG